MTVRINRNNYDENDKINFNLKTTKLAVINFCQAC